MKFKQHSLLTLFSSIALVSGTQAAQAGSFEIIADGLNQPRGFEFAPDGTLYIPEPGIGGDSDRCQPSPSTLFQPICAGYTGAITRVTTDGMQERYLDGFESLGEQPSGNQGAGPADIAFDDGGNAYLLTGFAGYPGNRDSGTFELGQENPVPESQQAVFPPSPEDELLETPTLAKLYEFDVETGELGDTIFDFAEAEITINPDGGDIVTNPYDLEISGDTAYIVDGGGNSAYSISLDGSGFEAFAIPDLIVSSEILSQLPPPPDAIEPGEVPQANGQPAPPESENPLDLLPGLIETVPGQPDLLALQSVSTGAAIGPDGAFYVGEYTGFPYPANEARIHRIGEDGEVEVFAEGFNYITDIQFDEDGNLLVLQFSDVPQFEDDFANLASSLIQLAPDGTRTTLVAPGEGLRSADGVTIGPDGQIYIANAAIGPGNGEIVRVDLAQSGETEGSQAVPEPTSIFGLLALCFGSGVLLKGKRKKEELAVTNSFGLK